MQTANGRNGRQHGGGIEGFNTFLAYYPDDKLTVVVLSNINGDAPTQIARKLADGRAWRPFKPPPSAKKSRCRPQRSRSIVGTYELAPGVNMWIRLEGDHLTTH